MKRGAVRLHAEARKEAIAAEQAYWGHDRALGDAFLLDLEHALDDIAEHPERWPLYLAGTRRYVMQRFPYLIVYRRRARGLQVVAVAHGKRRPGYWISRLH